MNNDKVAWQPHLKGFCYYYHCCCKYQETKHYSSIFVNLDQHLRRTKKHYFLSYLFFPKTKLGYIIFFYFGNQKSLLKIYVFINQINFKFL